MEEKNTFIPYQGESFEEKEMISRSERYFEFMNKRRSIRDYSDKDVPKEVVDNIIRTASSAPSGAHKQPWVFCVIRNSELKHRIRELAEEEERKNYSGRMSERWIEDLEQFGTNEVKEFIDIAPWIIVVMKKSYDIDEAGNKSNNYYVNESVGIACGFLISAIHNAGLVTLTHTPSPMNFISKALNRPENEKPYLLLPIGYAATGCTVPDIDRKALKEIAIYYS
ncbi:nitroreductase family protein [Crocinitomix catalasitica]|uniref:nitroreductase family protein n=1 Tax=Crocinitomix catalasitica TaxID=184607 RepID=UPI000483961B|nr:nitroreductase family protein [Crocinitomix catalasitica]